MKRTNLSRYSLALFLPLLITHANASVDNAQADALGRTLTPVGAERAGNNTGTIPEWTGGLPNNAGKVTDGHREDPFSGEAPLFTITAQNVADYQEKLSPGQKAMLARYPTTYKIPVYPTHRSVAWPEKTYEAVRKNAVKTQTVEGGNGLINYSSPLAFPIPINGLEIIWNHITRYKGGSFIREASTYVTTPQGEYSWKIERDRLAYPNELSDYSSETSKNILFYFISQNVAPAREAGGITLVHETLDQITQPRMAWQYNAGQRRVRRAPQVAYDSPGPGNLRTTDQADMFSGSPNRYDWKLIGKREMYVPYNSYRLASSDTKPEELITAGHINQDKTRYELHRVWEVEATLKPGERHIYSKRHLFIDEDSWAIVAADHYDSRGNLWRVAENHVLPLYDVQAPVSAGEITYDLLSGRYVANYMLNEKNNSFKFGVKFKTSDFAASTLRTMGIR